MTPLSAGTQTSPQMASNLGGWVYEHCVDYVASCGVLAKKNIFCRCVMGKGNFYFINLHGVHKFMYTQLLDRFEAVFMNIVKVYVVRVCKCVFGIAFSILAHFMKKCTTWYFINLHKSFKCQVSGVKLGGWYE